MYSGNSTRVIDFGKATALAYPITYKLTPKMREKHNLQHSHVEWELRNLRDAKTVPASDVFSLGYVFDEIARTCICSEEEKMVVGYLASQCLKRRENRASIKMLLGNLKEKKDCKARKSCTAIWQ